MRGEGNCPYLMGRGMYSDKCRRFGCELWVVEKQGKEIISGAGIAPWVEPGHCGLVEVDREYTLQPSDQTMPPDPSPGEGNP